MRYFIEFSYNGTLFFGYQIQPKQNTVQEELEKALSTILGESIKTTGAGRTDTGVHAKKMFAHFETSQLLGDNLPYRLNSFLPSSISIRKIFEVDPSLHARFSALSRTYQYHISLEKNPFSEKLAWQYWKHNLDIDKMNEACKILFEYRDFTSFAKLHSDNKTNICTIHEAFWKKNDSELIFTLSADRFLRNMVRSIVGTMEQVGSGKILPDALHRIIQQKNRSFAGSSAPAHGLFLVDITY